MNLNITNPQLKETLINAISIILVQIAEARAINDFKLLEEKAYTLIKLTSELNKLTK